MARPGLKTHPKFLRLVFLLQMPAPYVYGCLQYLWDVAYETGNDVLGDAIDVELAAQWPGQRGVFFQALVECRFLDQLDDGRYAIHDLFDHAPEYVLKRLKREEGRKHRYAPRQRIRRPNSELGVLIQIRRPNSELGTTPAPAPFLGEESPKNPSCSEPALPPSEPAFVLTFPCSGSGPKEWGLTDEKLRQYAESFPAVDVLGECRKALQWCRDNPVKRKTPRGLPAFLSRWLSKAQDSASRNGSQGSSERYRRSPNDLLSGQQEWFQSHQHDPS